VALIIAENPLNTQLEIDPSLRFPSKLPKGKLFKKSLLIIKILLFILIGKYKKSFIDWKKDFA
jgi:hypothetical protein